MSRSITITVAQARGSTPRDAGASMCVWDNGQSGSIGGGALEWEATRIAQDMLSTGKTDARRTLPLGPSLGQCCGGTVVLDFSTQSESVGAARTPVWIWGAGHVGRALVGVIAPLPAFDVTWIDTAKARFAGADTDGVTQLVAADPVRVVPHAPKVAHHLIVTYSHDIDLALCDALLGHGFGFAGLIGSATKWARFSKRLQAAGHADTDIVRITCPIGTPSLGKHPQAIAIGVAARLLAPAVATD